MNKMNKTNKKTKAEVIKPLTEVQIKVDTEKRLKAVNEEIGKVCEKYEVQLVPALEGWPMTIKPTIKIVSTKKYEEVKEDNKTVPA